LRIYSGLLTILPYCQYHGQKAHPTVNCKIDTKENLHMSNLYYEIFSTGKGLFKRSQHVGPTSSNSVACNMLASFEHTISAIYTEQNKSQLT
jgi:hypothetical protein